MAAAAAGQADNAFMAASRDPLSYSQNRTIPKSNDRDTKLLTLTHTDLLPEQIVSISVKGGCSSPL